MFQRRQSNPLTRNMRTFSRVLTPVRGMGARNLSVLSNNHDIFEYTSGRFLFNEKRRLAERRVQFDPNALATAICRTVDRPISDLKSISKLAEGGFNRVLQATFKDGYAVLARIPYNSLAPKHYAVASEAATLGLLHSRGLPVPKVLGYSSDHTNPVGVEYLLMEKIDGQPLGDRWFTIRNKQRAEFMKQIVELETRFMNISIPASGSLYYRKDLGPSESHVFLSEQTTPDDIVVGPIAQYGWWYQERASLGVDRGPWKTFSDCLMAPAKREIQFCEQFGRPRFHVERYLRELHGLKKMTPTAHVQVLSKYLQLAPFLDIPSDHPFSRPVLRHPDLSPNNLLVDLEDQIVGIIDWQHAAVLPLCLCANIPDYYQNWGDPVSEGLKPPILKLPEDFETLSQPEQESIKTTMRKQITHFYYVALTMKQQRDHFKALQNYNSMLLGKLYTLAGHPWEGDTVTLKYAMIDACSKWPVAIEGVPPTESISCPVRFSTDEITRCATDYIQEQEKIQEFTEMKEYVGVDSVGWIPDDKHLERAREVAQVIKEGFLENSNTDLEREAVRNHFPFDDHDEDA